MGFFHVLFIRFEYTLFLAMPLVCGLQVSSKGGVIFSRRRYLCAYKVALGCHVFEACALLTPKKLGRCKHFLI